MILLVYILTGVWNCIWGWRHDAITPQGFCVPNKGNGNTDELFTFVVIGTLFYSVIPAILIFIFNTLIISHLIVQRKRRRQMVQDKEKVTPLKLFFYVQRELFY